MKQGYVVDVVIPVHDRSRPIARAVSSVLDGVEPGAVRVTVVCHGLAAADVAKDLGPAATGDVRLLEFADGIRSAAGPFNFGVASATAEYVAVMGSDDFLEPAAMQRWLTVVAEHKPDVALVRLRYQNGDRLHSPLTRIGRNERLDPVRDRVFYRTAPLGLLRKTLVDSLGLTFSEGFVTGDDIEFSARLWTSGTRIDYLRDLPCYVIGSDAMTRTTTQSMPVEDFLRAVDELARSEWAAALPAPVRRSLAIKLARIHVLNALMLRPAASSWRGDDEVQHVGTVLSALSTLAPGYLAPLSRADHALIDAAADPDVTVDAIVAAIARRSAAGRFGQLMTRNPLRIFDRESTLTRYALYALTR